jgi:GMP synthase (glutamine-hydrolysing)
MKLIEAFVKARRPILGVCLGSQLLAAVLGASVTAGSKKEIGWYPVELAPACALDALWRGQPARFVGYHWHGDRFELPKNAVALASSEITPIQCFRFGDTAYGVLFHLEVSEVHIGKMLGEFADEIRQENLSGEEILGKAETYLPTLQKIGLHVFQNWIELL